MGSVALEKEVTISLFISLKYKGKLLKANHSIDYPREVRTLQPYPFLVPCSLNRVLSISVGHGGSSGSGGILLSNSIDFVRKTVVMMKAIS